MSLKAFHVFFVTVATLFCAGLGGWAVRQGWSPGGDGLMLTIGVSSLAVAVALVIYGVWFLRHMKGVGYL